MIYPHWFALLRIVRDPQILAGSRDGNIEELELTGMR